MRYAKKFRGHELAEFDQKAAAHFEARFVPQLEDNIGCSWAYATACNVISRTGEAGASACRALAARLSRLDNADMKRVDPRGFSLFASSFGRHSRAMECRDATIRIAEFCCDEPGVLYKSSSQDLSLLMNGFSKWPEQRACREAGLKVANDVEADLLTDFALQHLSTLVNSFSKWPQEPACERATIAVASELVRRGAAELFRADEQQLANLVNGFGKWPQDANLGGAEALIAAEIDQRANGRSGLSGFKPKDLAMLLNGFANRAEDEACVRASSEIARAIVRRAERPAQLFDFSSQDLSNLVSGFGKLNGKLPTEDVARALASEILRRADRPSRLFEFNPQDMASLANGFAKWPQIAQAFHAISAIAGEVVGRRVRLSRFQERELARLVHAFSKTMSMDDDINRAATVEIARQIVVRATRGERLARFSEQDLANLVNGFSKWPTEEDCGQAIASIAAEIRRRATSIEGLADFRFQHLANLVNGFSKWPERAGQAALSIATELSRRAEHRNGLANATPQDLANIVNGLSKWPGELSSHPVIAALASELRDRAGRDSGLSDFTEQHLANLANGFSKWPEQAARPALISIATELLNYRANSLASFDGQHLSMLANGLSKLAEDDDCAQAMALIGGEIARHAGQRGLAEFSPQGLANLVNGFSKLPRERNCSEAMLAIAAEICGRADRRDGLSGFTQQNLRNLANGFGKFEHERCGEATAAIAREMMHREAGLSDFEPLAVATLLHDFAKWPEEEACRQAVMEIARSVGAGARRFNAFTTPELGMLANALARCTMEAEDRGESDQAALLKNRLHKLAHHLYYANDRLQQAGVLSIANIFKAFGKARLFDDLSLLAPLGLTRLAELSAGDDFAAEHDLETMGHLSVAVLPLARSSQKQLRWHRRQALTLLNDIQRIAHDKITAHLAATDAERIRGPYASRTPALSIYQVLKARVILEKLYRRPYVEGDQSQLRIRQQDIARGTREILHSTRDLIERDLSNMSWNLIADIEADDPIDALDSFLEQNVATVHAQRPAAKFNTHQVLRDMDHEPRPPEGNAGLMQLPVVDMRGQRLTTDPEIRYSVLHRLTEGKVPVVAVQLPGKPSSFMLTRTLSVDGIPYRMDLFGGSKLKPPRLTLAQVGARAPGGRRIEQAGGKLLAIPYADTAAGTDFEQLSRAWAPFKEAYFYTQRRGFAGSPSIKGLAPQDSVLEGAFKISLLPDRPAERAHPFALVGPNGPIALRPHDGTGFIKASLAGKMRAVRLAGEQNGPDRVPAYAEGKRASVPASALHHYPRSEKVADEARDKARNWLNSRQNKELTSEELYRTVTAAHIDAPAAIAVPSSDGRLHVSTIKSDTLAGTTGVLIGRSPYDKPNLRPFAAEQVTSAADGDPTAAFLDRCIAVQYSLNVAQKSHGELAADDPTFFAKGLLIVVPDEIWPADFADLDLVMSAEDVKIHSSWTSAKDRTKQDTALETVGVLQAAEVFAPGSLVAVPPVEQKRLDGDFDGDAVIIVGDRPALYQHVRQFDQQEQAQGVRSLKPPKSHTPAIEDDRYQFSRTSQILAATQGVLETYTGLLRSFLAQSPEARHWFAERALFGSYEGIHHQLKRELRDLLDQEPASRTDIEGKLDQARAEMGAARHPVAREMADLLIADLEAWTAQGQSVGVATDGSNDARLTLSAQLCELFPDLAEAYPAAAQPRERIQLLVDNYPTRIHPLPDGYVADDPVKSANNFLSLGVKVGTDAYKSDTGARLFAAKSKRLQELLQATPALKSVPYTKSMAAHLNCGRLDVEATLADLKDNPTLAASVMEAAIKLSVESGILPEPSAPRPTNDDGAMITLSREEATVRARREADRARGEDETIRKVVGDVVANLQQQHGIRVNLPHDQHRLRTEQSLSDQLTGKSLSSGTASQLISNAVRHVFQIPDGAFTMGFRKAVLAFEEQGYTELSTTNWFRTRNPTYVGIKTVFATPEGYRFEVEFHTPASYQAKLANHDTYKMLQRGSRGTMDQSRAEQLVQRARQIVNEVPVPDQATSIPNWEAEAKAVGTADASAVLALRSAKPQMPKRSPIAGQIVAALGERPIVLVGMMGAGKSSIGSRLSKLLGLDFVDTDKSIETRMGKQINEIFKDHGEQYFRDLEESEILQLLERGAVVLATGGGAFMSERIRDRIRERGISIWINTDPETITKRLVKNTTRPLLQADNPEETIKEMMRERAPVYQMADLKIDPIDRRINKSADALLDKLHAKLSGGVVSEPG
ncbi:shikimate kinase [Bradyrhizobium elkanii]|uniref:Shikimate kinase n=1 Tax=Bradyrhizobium elkanii TaxID=29448 RepID=A0A8I1YHB2_BRAEL|nr:shikimate kinase [Bradyrhizobium elkanii]MBP1299731.1 shikimate kinase [Bradyrhizobium elkanii]MCS3519190.1 shikimate kinase [Bradyrhizobium elkanii]MCS4066849.1 shikimate kinase [Bradyrhizobium elkanii]MCS4082380.1 shikimate kinase [Bradyrhizobium elkanii]MCW2128039.1 shikimate kinase [Bradyrhizobium elkanii]